MAWSKGWLKSVVNARTSSCTLSETGKTPEFWVAADSALEAYFCDVAGYEDLTFF